MGIKCALITGAGSGIGRELALLLANESVQVIAVGRNRERLMQLPAGTHICEADITTKEGLEKVCNEIAHFVPDLVVNNAGVGLYGELTDQDPSELEGMIKTNCQSVVRICHKAAGCLKERGKEGVILNVSSVLAFFPTPLGAVYAATKAFVNHFSEALDYELRPYGIRVLVGCPGQVATDFRVLASHGKAPRPEPKGLVLDPKKVAEELIQQVQKKQGVRSIDAKYAALVFASKLVPSSWVKRLLRHMLGSRV